MKKIAMVLSMEPQDGGGYQYAMLMAECLKRLSIDHFELIAICTNRIWVQWCRENHIKYVRLNWFAYTEREIKRNLFCTIYSRIYSMYITDVGKIIRKEEIDILVLTSQLMYVPNLDVKIITPVFDLMHRYEPRFPEVRRGYKERELIFKSQTKYADYILTDSELGKIQFYESYFKKNRTFPHVVSLPYVVPDHVLKIQEQYIDVPDKYIFYPAQFWKHKNHINLIKAIHILKENLQDIQLVLVGSEKNCYREIKKYMVDNKLENNIKVLGFVSDENIVYLYRHAVGMIMPTYFGPTNIPPLEAMALGCPVAVSNKYAMPEQVGKAGLFFDPDSPQEIAECIRKLWNDDELRMRMRKHGYEKIKEWGQRKFENRFSIIIRDCLRN